MEFASPSRLYGALVVYYGVLQALHLVGLVGSAITWLQSGALGPLVPPPVGGWPRQAELFLLGTGLLDAAFALMGVAFAAGQRRGAKWAPWLGTVALTGSCYSAGIYLLRLGCVARKLHPGFGTLPACLSLVLAARARHAGCVDRESLADCGVLPDRRDRP